MYRFLMKGRLDAGEEGLVPAYAPEHGWKPSLDVAMRSAYAEANGTEPEFTNHTVNFSGPFSGTLDYLFLSGGVRAESMDVLPRLADAAPAPSEREPSDHWPLAGTLVVDCK